MKGPGARTGTPSGAGGVRPVASPKGSRHLRAMGDANFMVGERQRILEELQGLYEALGRGADMGGARARRTPDPILRARWLAIAAARCQFHERVAARIVALGGHPYRHPTRPSIPTGTEMALLLRADLAHAHVLSARCRRVARLATVLVDTETGALLEKIAVEGLAHAAELARALALHYAREARAAAH